ncbi:MAG: tRNA 2-thiocytidine biosynthesis TtcA family protein [Oscillospiraceae bacterium]|nr:tRNA 2-thiocytidine biosynthesis TtcA family protein [Oscillospiraceae bacterium]
MQRILGAMRRAIVDYKMVGDGDAIAVGISGGKDSLVLLTGLSKLREFIGIDYRLVGLSVDPCFHGKESDFTAVTALCERLGIQHIIRRSNLWEIVFVNHQETSPCSLCARIRRGMLHEMANEAGCNKIALGHHKDDAVETFIMNLFYEGRVGCFSPVSYLSRRDMEMIRPLCLCQERDIVSAARKEGLPIMAKSCPVDGETSRQKTKEWLAAMEKGEFPGLGKRLFGAMQRGSIDGW